MKFRVYTLIVLALVLITGLTAAPSLAQSDSGLTLRLTKVFGYASGSGKMQGAFTAKAIGPDNLSRVTFYIDGQSLGEAVTAPFSLSFNTDNYPLGSHVLSAVGLTANGQELRSSEVRVEFVSPQAGFQSALTILVPLLVVVIGISIGSILLTTGFGKQKAVPLGAPRNYGLAGGAICPKCKRPFPLHFFAINAMPLHKLDRCPHCGKWSLLRRTPIEILRAAEAAELASSGGAGIETEESEEEKMRKALDNSRYQEF